MNVRIPQPTETHLERLVMSATRSLNAIKSEPTTGLKQVELTALKEKIVKIEQHLESMAKGDKK